MSAAQAWEYCIVSTPPPGPVEVYVSYYTTEGLRRQVIKATSYMDGVNRVWPQIIAQLGLDGWELVHIDQAGAYTFKRPIPA